MQDSVPGVYSWWFSLILILVYSSKSQNAPQKFNKCSYEKLPGPKKERIILPTIIFQGQAVKLGGRFSPGKGGRGYPNWYQPKIPPNRKSRVPSSTQRSDRLADMGVCSLQGIYFIIFLGWWFQIFLMFTPTWGRFPIRLIFFRWVETTNQIFFSQALHQGGKTGRCHGVDLYLSATESFQMVDGLAWASIGKKTTENIFPSHEFFLVIQFVTFLGWWKRDPFKGLSDLQLGDEKVTLNHLVIDVLFI